MIAVKLKLQGDKGRERRAPRSNHDCSNKAFAGREALRRLASRRARVLEIVRHLVARRWRAALALAMRGAKPWSHSNTPSRWSSTPVIVCPALRGGLAFKRLQEAAPGSPSRPPPSQRVASSFETTRTHLTGNLPPEQVGATSAASFGFFCSVQTHPKKLVPPRVRNLTTTSLSQQATQSKPSLVCQSQLTAVLLAVDRVRGPQRHTRQTECAPKASRELGHLSRKRLKRRLGTSAARAWCDFRCAAAA
jgi:hypothetical protein